MRELIRRYQIFAAAIVAVVAAIIAYPAWVLNEALLDFMSPPRSTANVGLLLLIYVPLVLIGAIACWKVSKVGVDFLWQVGVASTVVILVMAVMHQSALSRKWEQTPQGRQEHETRGVCGSGEYPAADLTQTTSLYGSRASKPYTQVPPWDEPFADG